jgi:hypothetical protein
LKILLGVVVFAGGLFFLLIAAMAVSQDENRHSPQFVMFGLAGIFGALGAALLYTGVRLFTGLNPIERPKR